jgi:multidrug efflux pump subunit AcrA (membrane-fusion protein)
VHANGKVELREVKLGRNYGDTIEVLNGLTPSDRVVMNPPDALTDGDSVAVAPVMSDADAQAKAKP